jgi:hypothetical protein
VGVPCPAIPMAACAHRRWMWDALRRHSSRTSREPRLCWVWKQPTACSARAAARSTETVLVACPPTDLHRAITYGYTNFHHTTPSGHEVYSHAGGRAGYGALFWIVPKHNFAVVILANDENTATSKAHWATSAIRLLARRPELLAPRWRAGGAAASRGPSAATNRPPLSSGVAVVELEASGSGDRHGPASLPARARSRNGPCPEGQPQYTQPRMGLVRDRDLHAAAREHEVEPVGRVTDAAAGGRRAPSAWSAPARTLMPAGTGPLAVGVDRDLVFAGIVVEGQVQGRRWSARPRRPPGPGCCRTRRSRSR